jgi:hypothetical protein
LDGKKEEKKEEAKAGAVPAGAHPAPNPAQAQSVIQPPAKPDVSPLAKKDKAPEKDKKKGKKSAMIFVNELRNRLDTYFRIVVRNMRDLIPKLIGNFMVRAVQDKMQIELFKRLGEMRDAVNRGLGEVENTPVYSFLFLAGIDRPGKEGVECAVGYTEKGRESSHTRSGNYQHDHVHR